MLKGVNISFSYQARRALRMAAGSLDKTAAEFIRDIIRDKLEKMQFPISIDPIE